MGNKSLTLSKEAAQTYNLKGIQAGNYHFPGFGEIDLTSVTLEKANILFAAGFPFLIKKKSKAVVEEEK
jgi:hypothetical protein